MDSHAKCCVASVHVLLPFPLALPQEQMQEQAQAQAVAGRPNCLQSLVLPALFNASPSLPPLSTLLQQERVQNQVEAVA